MNPTAMQKVMGYYEYLPSVKSLSISSITDAVQTSIVTVRNEFSQLEDPAELRPDVGSGELLDFAKKQAELENNLTILTATATGLNKQRDLHSQGSACIGRIGSLLQKIHNLDHTSINLKNQNSSPRKAEQPLFYSDREHTVLDREEEPPAQLFLVSEDYMANQPQQKVVRRDNSSDGEYDHLDIIKSDTRIRLFFGKVATTAEDNNPSLQCDAYLREKLSKLQGIITALKERKSYVRTYVTRCSLRSNKQEKLYKT